MKNRNRYLYMVWCLLTLTCWGCSDFLDERSVNMLYPGTIDDFEQILLGEGYSVNALSIYNDAFRQTDLLEPKYIESLSAISGEKEKYLWNPKMYSEEVLGQNTAAVSNVWSDPYKRILGCNVVLDNVDETEGGEEKRESVKGEALALRSWVYLQLVNTFGVAWSQCDPSTEPGVVLKLNSDVRYEFPSRNTVSEVYTRIEKDLLAANQLLKKWNKKQSSLRIGHLAVKGMLSRMYLYEEKWDEAIKWADSVLAEKSTLKNLNTITVKTSAVDSIYDVEGIWINYWDSNTNNYIFSNKYAEIFGVSSAEFERCTKLSKVVDTKVTDLRMSAFFYRTTYENHSMKLRSINKYVEGIRTSELYLNRAEAYARKFAAGDASAREKAIENLQELRKNRLNESLEPEDLTARPELMNAGDLVAFCIAERARELGSETNHRWCDLRRCGMEVTHTWGEGGETVTKDMSRHVLPIPDDVLERNPSL
nr:RagB/SusD family nutrient uptake outer membrane protein [Odoribacter splanchnicus]